MDKTLPIHEKKDEIIQAVRANQVVILTGETGCGKTTQLPIMLYEAGLSQGGMIAIAEPRRVGAISVATYVAKQLETPLGELVGYKVRFDNMSVTGTAIKFLTNGILLQELKRDRRLSKYGVIVIDEAHERSIEGDLLLSLLKDVIQVRTDLRIIVASATIDTGLFASYFKGAPVISVPGRLYPVDVHHLDRNIRGDELMVEAIAEKVLEIDRSKKPGDILVFMPGRESIEDVIAVIWRQGRAKLVTLPLYSDLEPDEQAKVFQQYEGYRKVIIATNIAETSITIEGINFVVDSGLIKTVSYDALTGINHLAIEEHSKAGCIQRSGRAGRTQPGTCYRMYTQRSFESRKQFARPEIERMKLEGPVLWMSYLGIPDVSLFDFISKPHPKAFERAYESLVLYGALNPLTRAITNTGKFIASLPTEPLFGRLIAEAVKAGCVREIATIVAFFSAASTEVFLKPIGQEEVAKKLHEPFHSEQSDMLTLLNVWNAFAASNYSKAWCMDNFLQPRTLEYVRAIREQFLNILIFLKIPISKTEDHDVVLRCLVSGMRFNLLKLSETENYCGIFQQDLKDVRISPGSSLRSLSSRPMFVVASEIVETRRLYAHCNSVVQEKWISEFLPHLLVKSTTAEVAPVVIEKSNKLESVAPGPKLNGHSQPASGKPKLKKQLVPKTTVTKTSVEVASLATSLASVWGCAVK